MSTGPPPAGMTEAAGWRVASRTVLLVFALLLGLWLVVQLRTVVVQVLLAIILAAGMTPLVDRFGAARLFGRWRAPRALVVLGLYLVLIALLLLLGLLIVPPLVAEIEDLASGLPSNVEDLRARLRALPSQYPFLPANLEEGIGRELLSLAAQLRGLLSQALVVARLALGLLSGALSGIFVLILALYITADSHRILGYLVTFLPEGRQGQAKQVAEHIGQRLGGWVRGQLLLSAIIGLISLIGLSLIGVRYAVLLALVAAIGETIPMVGPIISAVPAVLIAFLHSPLQGFLTLGLYILVQQLENNLVVPKVMERAVSLHPLVIMLALLAGSELMGVAGAILSVPVTAALAVVVDEARRERLARAQRL